MVPHESKISQRAIGKGDQNTPVRRAREFYVTIFEPGNETL
jgi:hypothetical protein